MVLSMKRKLEPHYTNNVSHRVTVMTTLNISNHKSFQPHVGDKNNISNNRFRRNRKVGSQKTTHKTVVMDNKRVRITTHQNI